MDFLKPPTDNLYKFVAMSGLLLFLVSMTYPPWLHYRLSSSIFELEKDTKILKLETKAEETRRTNFKEALDAIRADSEATGKEVENLKRLVESQPSRAKVAREQKRRLLQAQVDEIQKRFHEQSAAFTASSDAYEQKLIESQYKLDLVEWTYRQLKLLDWVALFCVGLGSFMANAGFIFWYRRLQVHQDAILRKQAALESQGKSELPES